MIQDNETVGANPFRRFLQDELVRRCKQNPKYSLRSFAKSIGIGAPLLSMMLNSKRTITPKTIKNLAPKLGLTPAQIDAFLSKSGGEVTSHYNDLAHEHFQIISDWHHYAILELVDTDDFQGNIKWVARRLGIKVMEARFAVARLQKLGMLEIDGTGSWKNTSGSNTNMDNELAAMARKKLQRQILEKALEALDDIPVERRDQSSMTMAIDSDLLPEAKRMLTQFRRKLTQFLENGSKKDEVYHLGLSLYPVTKDKHIS